MCHVILAMPILGTGVFFIWPAQIAGPVYAVILLVSVVLYMVVIQTMRSPVVTGLPGLKREIGVVVDGGRHDVLVQIRNEIWKAHSSEILSTGEQVTVTGSNGLVLEIQRYNNQKKGVSSYA